ncbi:hypothetical protein A9R05_08040 [Burkholderia sp. KK1]|nr:hypothetical protein A9R05_08040 [Burkholderia sp. KK1]
MLGFLKRASHRLNEGSPWVPPGESPGESPVLRGAMRPFQTGWFVESLMSQTLIIHIIRTAKVPFVESRASAALIATSLSVAAFGMILPYLSLGSLLGFVPLPSTYWIGLLAMLTGYALLTHILKRWFVRRFGLN